MKCERNLNEGDRVRVLRLGKQDAHYTAKNKKKWSGRTGAIKGGFDLKKLDGRFYIGCGIVWDRPINKSLNIFYAIMLEKI